MKLICCYISVIVLICGPKFSESHILDKLLKARESKLLHPSRKTIANTKRGNSNSIHRTVNVESVPEYNTKAVDQSNSKHDIKIPFTTKMGIQNNREGRMFLNENESSEFIESNSNRASVSNKGPEDIDVKKPATPNNNQKGTLKSLRATKILFRAKPVVPENEVDSAATDLIYYID